MYNSSNNNNNLSDDVHINKLLNGVKSTPLMLPLGLTMITGGAASGKSSFMNRFSFAKSGEQITHDPHYTLGKLISSTTNVKTGEVTNFDSALRLAKALYPDASEDTTFEEIRKYIKRENVHYDSYVFTEQPEYRRNSDIEVYMMLSEGDYSWAININDRPEDTIIVGDLFPVLIVLGVFGIVRISSATPTFLKLKGYQDVLIKGGLSALYLDSLSILNMHAVITGSTIIAEVRDDFDDDGKKLHGAPRMYIQLEAFSIKEKRFRIIEGSNYTKHGSFHDFLVQAGSGLSVIKNVLVDRNYYAADDFDTNLGNFSFKFTKQVL
jgi:hypothetical protein